jgi:hypothetical protein
MEAPCFTNAPGFERCDAGCIGFATIDVNQCEYQAGTGYNPACPVGRQVNDGDPVFWQSDGAIQGGMPGDMQAFQGIGLPTNEMNGLGGGWALCFE